MSLTHRSERAIPCGLTLVGPGGRSDLEQNRKMKKILEFRKELLALLLLVSVALGLRLLYQQESVVENPLRADAMKYSRAAYNLHQFGVYSLDRPRDDLKPPDSRTDLSPGYPLFLSLLMNDRILDHHTEFIARVLWIQAVMGTLVAAFTFLTARLCLTFSWALLAGALAAFSPHLIAMSGFILTESLFIFLLMLGILLLSVAWRTDRATLTFVGSLFLATSANTRAVSYALILFLAPVFLVVRGRPLLSIKASWVRHLAALAVGFLVVASAHGEFVKLTVTHEPSLIALVTGKTGIHEKREPPQEYVVFPSPGGYLKRTFQPPKFYVDGKSHVLAINQDLNWKSRTEASFWEEPIAYLKWNLVGKFVVSWHWDNAYNGDVYIYPMIRKGFHENPSLNLVHSIMHAGHWPLFLLSMAAPVVLFVQWRRKTMASAILPILVPALGFIYFIGVLWVLSWLPRYTIPVRPLSYVLAAYSLFSITTALQKRIVFPFQDKSTGTN